MKFSRLIKNKATLAVLAIIAILLGTSELRQWHSRQAIQKEIDSLASESEKLDQKNKELRDSLVYLHSTSSKERSARQQLNLKKEGEIAVSFTNEPLSAEEQASQQANANAKTSNASKWWKYFFN